MNQSMTQQELKALLQHHQISATPQRLNIARRLFSGARHVTAEQLLGELREGGQRVSKATVYNTLGLFSRLGLVREVIVDSGRVFYDSNTRPHQHLYDAGSASLTDIGADAIDVRVQPDLPADMEIEAVDVIIRVRPRES